jgi:hypothetical protein
MLYKQIQQGKIDGGDGCRMRSGATASELKSSVRLSFSGSFRPAPVAYSRRFLANSLANRAKTLISAPFVASGRELNGRSHQSTLIVAAGPVGPSSRASAF